MQRGTGKWHTGKWRIGLPDFVLLLALVPLIASGGFAWAEGTVYKCRNPQGKLSYQESPCKQDAQSVASWAAAEPQQEAVGGENFKGTLVIKQHPSGHYFLNGSINGRALTFVVDTGASSVVLPRTLALSARIYCKDRILMQTANGSTSACTAVVPRLKLGPLLMKDVPAAIVPNLDQPLLGMNVLRQFRIEQDDGEMRISTRD